MTLNAWALALIMISIGEWGGALPPQAVPPVFSAREIPPAGNAAATVYFARPVAIGFDKSSIFVLEAQDAEVKVFRNDGVFVSTFSRKGQAPGELHHPSDMDILGDTVYIADGGNRRVQVLTREGRYLGGFNTGFFPSRVLALDRDRIVVVPLPSGRGGGGKVLHCFNSRGEELWSALDSRPASDPVLEAMENQVMIRRGGSGEFYVLRPINDSLIRRFDASGSVVAATEIEPGFPLREITVPAIKGSKKTLRGLCWNFAADGESLYLLLPEPTPQGDFGPGKRLAVVSPAGRTIAFIDLPDFVTRFAVDGRRIMAIDLDYRLRLFSVEKK